MEGGSVFGRSSTAKRRLSAPRSLKAASVGVGGVTLKWNALKGAKHYVILRDGKSLGKTTHHSYTDHNVVAGKTYRYTVRAYDAHNKAGAVSTSVRVTIPTLLPNPVPGPAPTNNPIAPIATVGPPQAEPAPTPNPTETPTPSP